MMASKPSSYFIASMGSFSGIFLITSMAVIQGVSINLVYRGWPGGPGGRSAVLLTPRWPVRFQHGPVSCALYS